MLFRSMVTERMWARHLSPARFGEPAEAARRIFAGISGEIPICLSHLGLERDRALAEACPELPLILGGHSHTPLDQPLRVGDTVITQNAPYGATLTRVTLVLDGTNVRVADVRLVEMKLKAG